MRSGGTGGKWMSSSSSGLLWNRTPPISHTHVSPPLTSCVVLHITVLAYFDCWFSVAKCHVRFCLRRSCQMGWGTWRWGKSTDKQAQHVCFFIRGAYVYMFVACNYMFMFVSDSVLFTCKSHQSRSASASQARVRGHARLFYYLPIYAVWKELMQ